MRTNSASTGPIQAACEGAQRTDAHGSALAYLRQAGGVHTFAQDLQRAARVGQEALAQRREPFGAAAEEEGAADGVLEGEDARADRRLAEAERESGAAETALARHAIEGDQLFELH